MSSFTIRPGAFPRAAVSLTIAVSLAGANRQATAADVAPEPFSPRATSHHAPRPIGDRGDLRIAQTQPETRRLLYRFTTGEAFAYAVSYEWTTASGSGRLSGMPFFRVSHADDSEAVMLVIGRLRYEKIAADGTAKRVPANDYWLGTTISIHDRTAERVSAKQGQGGAGCPFDAGSYFTRFLFPELPHHDRDEMRTGGTIKITEMQFGPGGYSSTIRGKQTFTTRAQPLGGSLVRIDIERRFDPDNGFGPAVNPSVAAFDRRLGAVIEHAADWSATVRRPYTVKLHLRRIDDSEKLEQAMQLAMQDYKDLPPDMEPTELLRKRLPDMHLPPKYSAEDLPAPGTVVGYWDKGWFAVQFIRKVEPYKVTIRFLGSNETATVHPGKMAKLER